MPNESTRAVSDAFTEIKIYSFLFSFLQSGKRSAEGPPEEITRQKRQKKNDFLLEFHFKYLLKLLEGMADMTEAVRLLQESRNYVDKGAKLGLLQWHLQRVQNMVPNDTEILTALDMVSDCVYVYYND